MAHPKEVIMRAFWVMSLLFWIPKQMSFEAGRLESLESCLPLDCFLLKEVSAGKAMFCLPKN